jgi:protein-L-isoaspartate(D-aspartate) O-methyltransferase
MIAIMLDALDLAPDQRVLEVGAGCGYAAALLGQLAREVHGIEIRSRLAEMAKATLAALGVSNVHIHVGDGCLGLPELAPFDRILVSAAPSRCRMICSTSSRRGPDHDPRWRRLGPLMIGTRTCKDA